MSTPIPPDPGQQPADFQPSGNPQPALSQPGLLNSRLSRGLLVAILPVAAFCLIWRASNNSEPKLRTPPVKDESSRQTAPDFALKDVNGRTVHLSDYRGKVVLLDFWATWCGPCKLEIPWFMEFERKYKDRGFSVLGVSMDDDGWKAVKPFIEDFKVNYRIVLGDDRTGDQYGGIEALPTAFLIDREGRVAVEHVGVSSRRDFEDGIEKLLEAPVGDKRAALN
ncbi:MAG TPA: redoxin domain-containing protein [Bryobacteraceae bacterium]